MTESMLSKKNDSETLHKGLEITTPPSGLSDKLELATSSKRKLRVKLGFDPTSPDLHLGHAVVLKKLRQFQQAGHEIHVIIGDFTAMIGDPTGKNKSRPPLEKGQVDENAETYLSQVNLILTNENLVIHRNSEWLSKINLAQLLKLMAKITIGQLLQRNDFKNRYEGNKPIGFHEFMYPLLQAIDSVEIKADVELGGTDQLFNCMMGRELQSALGKPSQAVICVPLLVGTDGTEKMSKSLKNDIPLKSNPTQMFGKIMSIPDGLIENYLDNLCFDKPDFCIWARNQIESGQNPMIVKLELAQLITAQFHGENLAEGAKVKFKERYQNRGKDESAYENIVLELDENHIPALNLINHLVPKFSNSEIRRLMKSGAIEFNSSKITDPYETVSVHEEPGLLRIGKRHYFKFVWEAN